MFRTKSRNLRRRTMAAVAWSILVLVLLLPLAFINIRGSHDWGDDFAMYLLEAQNISHHRAADDTGFMTNPNAEIGPPAYPVGFPLLLAPFVKRYGLNFEVLNRFQSALLILALFSGFFYLRRHFSAISSLGMTLVIAYNPVLLNFKTEILSDIPFWICTNLLLCLVYYNRNGWGWMLLTGLLVGFSLHLRSMGFALLLAFFCYRVVNDLRHHDLLRRAKGYLAFLLGFFSLWLGIRMVFPVNSAYTYLGNNLVTTTVNHLSYNLESIANFFRSPELSDYYFITSGSAWVFMTFLFLGMVLSLRQQKFSFAGLLTFIFFGAVVLYHLGDAGIRLILPLLFVFFYYFAFGFKTTLGALQLPYRIPAWILGGLLMGAYITPLNKIMARTAEVQEGPCTAESWELFSYLKQQGITTKNIGFDRPRVICLFTGNNSVHLSDAQLNQEVGRYRLDYVLAHVQETSAAKKEQLAAAPERFEVVFSNRAYTLYRVKP